MNFLFYSVCVPVVRCEIILSGEKIKEVMSFKYLGTVLSKHRETEREISERIM